MLYSAYQTQTDFLAPLRALAGLTEAALRDPLAGPAANPLLRSIGAAAGLLAHTKLSHVRPDFGIRETVVDHAVVPVHEEIAFATPFGAMLHFAKESVRAQPRVLLVAPMAGHFATLLRDTVATLLPDHDVFLTDWFNARDVPREAGRFGLDEYVEHMILFLEQLGPDGHVIGVCQPCAALLAAVAIMAEEAHPATPRSMTLMAGPIDTRINPTPVNDLATGHPIGWFERKLIATVPGRYAGAHRRVYPGFLQLSAFMSMNMARHWRAHIDLFGHLVCGEDDKAKAAREFYDEYFAVLDLPAEFYLETVARVFQEFELPRGAFTWHGRRADPSAIRKTALFTVEGERDDICSVGQTVAAQDLCTSLKPFRRRHHMQPGVGHYGVFSGRRWQHQIYPILKNFIQAND
ncbi:MAG: polyhydroxyalkanoate depolymerase [Alphaproteobacteria bacterium]|nr:polyhydroxyalkanoate depolymerase [Alphaproteobacteria bacterium]MBU6471117.1 polyhydroxyalkanoate depolymerase [Alphaproteobacteria bacterium]MDE2011710.1 polyhydroxyalkanoate depolymerase [Alphaproteobacteria bacterium]MDE2074320.1 polyhydroxyalkanoate depolymerase [Alphaproteobacteria bacterium]MDE2353123.1 polyhydroxyalkanoate depolymerase [Alphaproteobacteria bacterium]